MAKKAVTEETPFDEDTLVFKVAGKVFAITDMSTFEGINLKVEPAIGAELREQYDWVVPGYHMNKKHWITVKITKSTKPQLLKKWIDNSYNLVVQKLPVSTRLRLKL